jgi:hypothetical protein
MYRSSDMIERFAMLRLVPDEITKEAWLEKLVTGVANATSIANRVRNLCLPRSFTSTSKLGSVQNRTQISRGSHGIHA